MVILLINTANNETLELGLAGKIKSVAAKHMQAEKLLPEIDLLLQENNCQLSDLEKIVVENSGQGFTSLRLGVTTANALAFALNVPVSSMEAEIHHAHVETHGMRLYVQPKYDRPASVTIK